MVVKDVANSAKNFHSLMRLTGYFQQHVDAIADALASDGYVIIDQALSDDMTEQLRLALRTRRDAMAVAAVGRQGERQVDTTFVVIALIGWMCRKAVLSRNFWCTWMRFVRR